MCANRAVVDTVECYMDDLIECFEGFVKKSLIIISIGIGVIVGLLMYLLRLVSERIPTSAIVAEDAVVAHTQIRNMSSAPSDNTTKDEIKMKSSITQILELDNSNTQIKNNKIHDKKIFYEKNVMVKREAGAQKTTTGVNTVPTSDAVSAAPSLDESVLRDVGLSCSRVGSNGRVNSHSYIPCRVPVPGISTPKRKPIHSVRSINKHYIPSTQVCPNHISRPDSCCSMCCHDGQS